MRNFILIIMFGLMVQIANAQVKVTDLAETVLKGHIKEVIEYTFRGDINSVDIDTTKQAEKRILKFDEKGNELEAFMYDKNGHLTNHFIFTYPDANTVISSQFDATGKFFTKSIYKYDKQGREIELDPTFGNNILSAVSKFTYKYDGNGNRIEEDTYGTDGQVMGKSDLSYNQNNQCVQEITKGTYINEKNIYKYDSFGNQIKSESYSADGKLKGGYISLYANVDKNGNWLFSTSEEKGHSELQGDYLFKDITKKIIKYY